MNKIIYVAYRFSAPFIMTAMVYQYNDKVLFWFGLVNLFASSVVFNLERLQEELDE